MVERLMVLAATAAADPVQAQLEAVGGRMRQAFGARVWIVDVPSGHLADLALDPAMASVHEGPLPDDDPSLGAVERAGIAAWNLRQSASFRASRTERTGEGRSWGDGVEPEG